MEPRRESCTTRYKFALSAISVNMTSDAFPKVALIRPPAVGETWWQRCSVTKERRSAKGTRFRRERMKIRDWADVVGAIV